MKQRQRQATLQSHCGKVQNNSSNSQRRTARYAEPGPGDFSAPVARLSKWPKNIFFASDFIADKASASENVKHRATRPSHATAARCPNVVYGKNERRSGTKVGAQEPRLRKKSTTSGPSGGRTVLRQSIQGLVVGDGKRNHHTVVADYEEASFMERSACALLLLHSRFFGGAKNTDDVVCALCKLCREAGWMGNPLRECPDLDPLVLDKLLREPQRGKRSSESGRGCSGGTCPATTGATATFSFEDLYRILAAIASLVYPHDAEGERKGATPRRAVRRLLMEGVLPLAADNQPRRWSPRSEILYGRPAQAALSMQRDTLHQLYCTYDARSRAKNGSGGVSRNGFLQMLADLGISPASVSENRAADVFNDVVHNGLPEAELLLRHNQGQQSQGKTARHGAGDGSNDSTEFRGRSGGKQFARQLEDHRLDWSLFLEAMAALAVGAVKDGQGTPTKRDRVCIRTAKSSHWKSTHRNHGIQEGPGAACRAVPSWTEQPSFPDRHGCYLDVKTESVVGGISPAGAESTTPIDRAAMQARVDTTAELAPGTFNPPSYGGGVIYRDSRRSFELMPTLPEGGRVDAPVRSSQPNTIRAREGTRVIVSNSSTRTSEPLSQEVKTPMKKGNLTATPKSLLDSKAGGVRSIEGQTHNKTGYRTIKQPATAEERAVRGARSSRRSSARVGESFARVTHEASETEDPTTATSDVVGVAECPTAAAYGVAFGERAAGNTTPGFQADIAPSKENVVALPLDGRPGEVRGRSPSGDVCIAARTDGRHACRQPQLSRGASRQVSLRPNTSTEAVGDGVTSEIVSSSQRTGVDVCSQGAAYADTSAYFKPGMTQFSSPPKMDDGTTMVALPLAPCHGGSPSAIFHSSLPVAADRPHGAVYTAPVNTVLPPATVTREETDALETDKPLRQPRVQSQADELRPGYKSAGNSRGGSADHNADARGHADGSVAKEEDGKDKRHQDRGQEINYAARITMELDAAGCTAKMYEDLLDPGIAAVYSRQRKELLVLFQRYRRRTEDKNRRPSSGSQGVAGCVDDVGIRRFVNDFPPLRRWAEGDSMLPLIVRASRQRGQPCCDVVPLGSSSGLSYFGFLEVLTRMAYATCGQQPLHAKLSDLLAALKVHDPRGT